MTLGLIFEKAKLSTPRPLQLPFLLHWCNQACLPNLPRLMLIQVSVQISSHWKGLPNPSVWSSILPQTLSSHLFSSYSSLYEILFLHVSLLSPPIRKEAPRRQELFISLVYQCTNKSIQDRTWTKCGSNKYTLNEWIGKRKIPCLCRDVFSVF